MKTKIAVLMLCVLSFAAGKKPLAVSNDVPVCTYSNLGIYTNLVVAVPPEIQGSNWMLDGIKIHSAGGVCFWAKWQIDTNQSQRTAPLTSWAETAPIPLATNGLVYMTLTNNANYWGESVEGAEAVVENGMIVWRTKCRKEHWDGDWHDESTYTQSNLLSYVAFRGVTNITRLESICVSTNVRKWHWEKKKVYEDEL